MRPAKPGIAAVAQQDSEHNFAKVEVRGSNPRRRSSHAGVAQTAEQLSCKQQVVRSVLTISTKHSGYNSAWQSPRFGTGKSLVHTEERSDDRPKAHPTAQTNHRIDSSTGRAPGSYPGGCEVGTRSIHQSTIPVAQRGERRSYKAEAGGASPPRVTSFDGTTVIPRSIAWLPLCGSGSLNSRPAR